MSRKHEKKSDLSDRWLDDENSVRFQKRGGSKKSVSRAQGEPIAVELTNAVVVEVFPKLARARMDGDPAEFLCSYRRAEVWGATSKAGTRERSPVVVGDRVRTQRSSPDSGIIDGVSSRRNSLSRLAPGRVSGNILHTLAANLDQIVIVASAVEPEFSPGLVDRFLVAALAEEIPAVLCVTKLDLWNKTPDAPRPWQLYLDLGIPVIETCATSGAGIEELRAGILGKVAVFCGHSGVGKTSLLNVLRAGSHAAGKVGEVSDSTGKGRHTTTSAIMLASPLPGADRWIDTPGVREFALLGIAPEQLVALFPELSDRARLGCRSAGCNHRDEEGCAAAGQPRLASYLRMLASLEEMLAQSRD